MDTAKCEHWQRLPSILKDVTTRSENNRYNTAIGHEVYTAINDCAAAMAW